MKNISDYVRNLNQSMEYKWSIGRDRYGDSWKDSEPQYMFRRMEEELYEFRQAVEHDRDTEEAIKELADIMNYGIMFLALKEQ